LGFGAELLGVGFVVTYSQFGNPPINVFEDDIFNGLFYISKLLGIGVGFFIFIISYSVGKFRPSGNI
jgi:hypothetical protein